MRPGTSSRGPRCCRSARSNSKARLGERFRELDVPLLVQWPDGRREALLFVLEEETDPRRFSIHRLAHYCLDLADLFETDRVVPVVIFLRGRAPRRALDLGSNRHTYLSFRYLACELASLPYEDYRDSDNIVARLNLPNMRYAPGLKVDAYAHAVRGLARLEVDIDKQLKYIDFIDMYADLNETDRAKYKRDYPQEAQIMDTFSERFIQQGVAQGVAQGMAQGEHRGVRQGEAKVLLTLLQIKFGTVPETIRQAIAGADAETLLQWSTRVLSATRIEDAVSGID